MAAHSNDPLRELEHSHEALTRLALEASGLLRASVHARGEGTTGDAVRRRLRTCLESLRDELLRHFAVEEEGLFPFLRANVPGKADHVDRLARAHDTICGAVVRLAHAADASRTGEGRAALAVLHERFESAYALHSREEADLLTELGRALDVGQRAALAELLRGL